MLLPNTGAAKCSRELHNGKLPLHCAVSFGCSGRVLKAIIQAHPLAQTHKECVGNTPLHEIFDMETNTERWNEPGKSNDPDGDERLSEETICEVLLDYIPEEKMVSWMMIQNNNGLTVVEAAKQCKEVFDVPNSLIKTLEKAASGKFTARKQSSRKRVVDTNLAVSNPFDMSTDEGSSSSESDLSSDDTSDSDDTVELIS